MASQFKKKCIREKNRWPKDEGTWECWLKINYSLRTNWNSRDVAYPSHPPFGNLFLRNCNNRPPPGSISDRTERRTSGEAWGNLSAHLQGPATLCLRALSHHRLGPPARKARSALNKCWLRMDGSIPHLSLHGENSMMHIPYYLPGLPSRVHIPVAHTSNLLPTTLLIGCLPFPVSWL